MGWFEFDAGSIDDLYEKMVSYGTGSGQIIDKVLRSEGAEEIKKQIARLLPSSGRHWKGKAPAASSAMPGRFDQDNGELSVTIAARGKYHYLYFPDDGSNTRKHAGNKQFMLHGAEAAAPKVVEMCVGKLAEAFNN
ncbi:MAG: hypothetical protein MR596_03470 [Lachnospiraceae bacterium]|jgi:hypothetical protein|nr:hypothetical protein [Lachnospiraceae bacterium]MCI6766853.1 hypothetical protein [Lachnospiraceae bacterium]